MEMEVKMDREMWVEKYRPQRIKDVLGNPGSIKAVMDWIETWKSGRPKKRALLLHGPPGTGKTSIAYALSKELNYDYIELNASDNRTHGIINKIVGSASSLGTLNPEYERKVIILDEVDGIHGKMDYGGLRALKTWAKNSSQPIILIANDPWKLSADFRALTVMVSFKKVDQRTILKVLRSICRREDIETDEKVLKIIATNASGDLRSAINDLQGLTQGRDRLELSDIDVLTLRDSGIKIFDTVIRILKTTSTDRARETIWDASDDPDTVMKWLVENVPREYDNPDDLKMALGYLSRADVFMGRIMRRQDWGLLSYATDLMSAGVSVSKSRKYSKFVRYQYPQIFTIYSKTKKKRALMGSVAQKIGGRRGTVNEKVHCSKKEAISEYFPLLEMVMKSDTGMASHIASELGFDMEEIQFFVGEKTLSKRIYDSALEITRQRIRGQTRKEKVKQVSLFEF